MRARTDTDARLRGLIDILEDCRRFYLDAIPGSTGRMRWLHEKKAQCYEAMLVEIRHWCARQHVTADHGATDPGAATLPTRAPSGIDDAGIERGDDFAALLRRVNRLHESLTAATRAAASGVAGAWPEAAGVPVAMPVCSVRDVGRRTGRAGTRR